MCLEPVRTHRYRLHPPGSPMFERCAGLAWCSGCRIYEDDVVHVPCGETLPDALAPLPADARERLLRKETALVDHLDRLGAASPRRRRSQALTASRTW
ncbi:hypothetical protein [Streptomyces sp. NRRL F-5123]|uniref:hypothetical protein n=1 Tax=Streptomyces sp. NRRL F-5123 TaxID=1463856 RepID=UPI0004E1CDFD|nr:hypothetical protein [Streptomyces sp. NRRL F-5123]